MNFSTLFAKKKPTLRRKVNVLSLKQHDICYYDQNKAPFEVVETGVTQRGVYYVEIRNTITGKSHLFTDNYQVLVDGE